MGHRAQQRAYRPWKREGSHPPPRHQLYAGAAMNQRYKERPKGASRSTHGIAAANFLTAPFAGMRGVEASFK